MPARRHRPELALDIVPLFETIDDLRRAGEVMAALLAVPDYRRLAGGRAATARR